MAFLEETPRTMRLFGLLGAAFSLLLGVISNNAGPLALAIRLGTVAINVAYVVVGFSFKSLLSSHPRLIEGVLIAGLVWFLLVTAVAIVIAVAARQFEVVGPIIPRTGLALLLTLYLFVNVRRLAEEGQSSSPPPSSTEFTSIRRKQEP